MDIAADRVIQRPRNGSAPTIARAGRRGASGLGIAVSWPAPEVLAVAGLVLAAVAARVFLLERSHWMVEGDEAMVGLLAKHIIEGERPVFLAGQDYMGALQAYEAALFYQVLGMSRLALKLVPLLASVAFVLSTYWLARRLLSPRAALMAGALAAIPPIYVAANTLRALGPYTEVMALGNALLAVTASLVWRDKQRPRAAFVLGLLAGFAFWLNPVAVHILATSGLLVLATLRLRLLPLVPALAGGLAIGGAPVWIANLGTDFATFRYLAGGAGASRDIGALAQYALHSSLPRVLGLWQPWGQTPSLLSWSLGALIGAGVLALLVRGRQTHGWRLAPSDLPVVFVMVGAALFLFTGLSGPSLNPWGFDATGRYVVPLWSAVPLALAALGEVLWRRARVLGLLTIGVALAAHAFSYQASEARQVFQSPYWSKLPYSSRELLAYLDEHDIRYLWLNHWAATPLMFDARETVIAADYYDVFVGGGVNRFPGHMAEVAATDKPAFVLVTDEPEPRLEGRLRALGVAYQKAHLGTYVVLQPVSRHVAPAEVADTIGYEY